jgi:hypothetical protein
MKHLRIFPILVSLYAIGVSAHAQAKITEHVYRNGPGVVPAKAVITDFARMIGYWKGQGLGGVCEELWMPEAGGLLHGSFRMATKGKLSFSEFMTITIDSTGHAILKVKHFNPDFTGWEEKDKSEDFLYLKQDGNAIYFSGMTYLFEADNRLIIFVTFKSRDGKYGEQKFSFTKVSL